MVDGRRRAGALGVEPGDLLEGLQSYDLLLGAAGLALLAVAVLPRLLHDKPLSVPIIMVALGVGLFSLPVGLDLPDPIAQDALTERLTELGVIASLMVAGLTLGRPPGLRSWASTWRLLAITMPVSIAGVALLGWWAGMAPPAAVLLGAVIAPTDPVQGKDLEVGAPQEGADEAETEEHDLTGPGEEDEVRFALTSEAGLNDGLAFPFTNMAIAMAVAGSRPGNWLGSWFAVDVLYEGAVAVALGLLIGRGLGMLLLRLPAGSDLSEAITGIGALAATLLVYGLTEYAGGYGFVATFVAAASIRAVDRWHHRHRHLQTMAEAAERILMVVIMGLFGGAIAGGLLAPLGWEHIALAVTVLVVVRPIAGAAALLGMSDIPLRDRAAISFYGVRGIATFYYLAYAMGEAEFPAKEELWATAGLIVLLSVVVHGITAAPVMDALDERREA